MLRFFLLLLLSDIDESFDVDYPTLSLLAGGVFLQRLATACCVLDPTSNVLLVHLGVGLVGLAND